jgi:hypothetical protein
MEMTRRRWIVFGLLDAVAIAVVVAIVLIASGGDSDSSGAPEVLTASALSERAADSATPIYWLGPRAGARYELSETDGDRVFVRYLDGDATAGGSSALTVATYPAADPVAELHSAAGNRDGARLVPAAGGAVILVDPSAPENAHLAYPGGKVQVEVFSPVPGQALRLAGRGAVVPVPSARG